MNENEVILQTDIKFKKIIKNLKEKISTIIATGAHPSLLNNIKVEYYDVLTPLNQIASISSPDATMIIVKPFDKTIIKNILEAIHKSSLDFNVVDEGEQLRIMIPAMTNEKRDFFIKEVKTIGENAKIFGRNIRIEALKKIRLLTISENELRKIEDDLQKIVNDSNKEIDSIIVEKSKLLSHI